MGGDFGPRITVPAAVQALSHFPEIRVIITGNQEEITNQLSGLGYYDRTRVRIVHCPQVISNSERPSVVLRRRLESSMSQAIRFVASGDAQACVSGGNTGALVALSRFFLKSLPGIDRPALAASLPTSDGKRTWMLDLGANVSSDVSSLFQFAVMGSALAEQYLYHPPQLAILNIGEEETKGNNQIKTCAKLLRKTSGVRFIGNIEGGQILSGIADVIVCDGFVGNICLKSCEGVARVLTDKLKSKMSRSSIKSWVARKLFHELFTELKAFNPDRHNGASLLGLRGIVVKSHGRADVLAFLSAIGEALREMKKQIPNRISDRLKATLIERRY